MTVNEWNDVLRHAKAIETDTIKTSIYTMYDGAKGITVKLIDINGDTVDYRHTGVHNLKEDYIDLLGFYKYLLLKSDNKIW